MKFFKKNIFLAIMVLMVSTCLFSGCEIANDGLMKSFEGKYTYQSAVDTTNDRTAYDYQGGGNLTLTIRDGKAVFNNLTAPTGKDYVFVLEASILGNSLKLLGNGYFYQDVSGNMVTKQADYVFGSANFVGDNLVVKLMFVSYATTDANTSLMGAIEVTFTKA